MSSASIIVGSPAPEQRQQDGSAGKKSLHPFFDTQKRWFFPPPNQPTGGDMLLMGPTVLQEMN